MLEDYRGYHKYRLRWKKLDFNWIPFCKLHHHLPKLFKSYYEKINSCDDVFAVEYESFLVNDEPEYDAFKSDDLYSTTDCLLTAASESASKTVSPPALELKPLLDSLKYTFLGPNESLPVIIASDLDGD